MTLSNEDIFYIPGVHEIIMNYKKDMDVVLKHLEKVRKHRIKYRNWIATNKHAYRMAKANKRMAINYDW